MSEITTSSKAMIDATTNVDKWFDFDYQSKALVASTGFGSWGDDDSASAPPVEPLKASETQAEIIAGSAAAQYEEYARSRVVAEAVKRNKWGMMTPVTETLGQRSLLGG